MKKIVSAGFTGMMSVLWISGMQFLSAERVFGQTAPCDVTSISHNPDGPVFYSPDSSRYFICLQDSSDVFQIYVGDSGDPNPVCISTTYTSGNCCGLLRHWSTRNKLQVQWHASGNYIICAVEKEFYNELLYVPYPIRLGWLQSGMWMDIWAVTPDGSHWYNLASTEHGFTGPAFTPDGTTCVWAEALDSSNLLVDVFGRWKLHRSDFSVPGGSPVFTNSTDITPAGARWVEPGNFSPDGQKVLLSADVGLINAEGQDQYILDITNGSIVNLTNSPMVWDEHGVFSPDGNKILFMSSYPYQSDTNSYHTLTIKAEFMLMDSDGSNLQQLTHFRDTGYVESSPGIAATGFWTPDGSRIYAQSLIFPDYDNWIIDFYGNCGNSSVTGTPEIPEKTLTLFPNPATENLTLQSETDFQDAFLTVFNTVGQPVIMLPQAYGTHISLDIHSLNNGLYIVQVVENGNVYRRTFVKSDQ